MGGEAAFDRRTRATPHGPVRLGAGEALDSSVRAEWEPRFGFDFGPVRIHRDDDAVRAAIGLEASAFTIGRHIAFNRGQYRPHTSTGRDLLAHELTHVVQQAGRVVESSAVSTVGDADDVQEREADTRPPMLTPETPRIRRRVSPEIERIRSNLSYGPLDWAVREYEVREVLGILKQLTDEDLQHTLGALGPQLTNRILAKVGDADRAGNEPLLDRIRQFKGASFIGYYRGGDTPRMPADLRQGSYILAAPFGNLDELIAGARNAGQQVSGGPTALSRLGILAHGDSAGEFSIGSTLLNLTTIDTLRGKLATLGQLLSPRADVYIYGCVSGGSKPGSALLKELSLIMPGRRIIGFNTITQIRLYESFVKGSGGLVWPNIRATTAKSLAQLEAIKAAGGGPEPPVADETAPQAKVALNGKIVKWPSDEANDTQFHDGDKATQRQFHKAQPTAP